MKTINTKVAGVTYGNRQYLIRKYVNNGDKIYLVPEFNNKHDKNAIAVYIKKGFWIFKTFYQLGYLKKEFVNEKRPEPLNLNGSGTIIEVTGGYDGLNFGLNIELYVKV